MDIRIRAAERSDEPFLWEMLFEAAHMAQDGATAADEARAHPYLARYLAGWGRPDDVGVVAEEAGTARRLGAAWARLLDHAPGSAAGAGEALPEVAIAVVPGLRGGGIGGRLIRGLCDAARLFYPALALTVRDENPARRMYERAGFVVTHTITNRVGGRSVAMRADLLDDPAGGLRLVEPDEAWRRRFQVMAREYLLAGEDRYDDAIDGFDARLARIRRYAAGENLPEGHVPGFTYWAVAGETLVGAIRLRPYAPPHLQVYGGNIGYDVRPALRGRGCGTRMLALCLEQARTLGLARALVTCDDDNLASARVIEKNGGVLEDTRFHEPTGKLVRRYWIALA
ncbi:MAG TPA: GNAT family N-acetyltransferase [Roseiflexaceae bacterium]|nr:GNAT family N-acetyltransferase [Roseiflexaceae bacterium]